MPGMILTAADYCPDRYRESLDRYAMQGIPTGACLRAVLAGDLFKAFAAADPTTVASMSQIVAYIVERLPVGCSGSYELVDSWIETYRLKRAEQKEARRG